MFFSSVFSQKQSHSDTHTYARAGKMLWLSCFSEIMNWINSFRIVLVPNSSPMSSLPPLHSANWFCLKQNHIIQIIYKYTISIANKFDRLTICLLFFTLPFQSIEINRSIFRINLCHLSLKETRAHPKDIRNQFNCLLMNRYIKLQSSMKHSRLLSTKLFILRKNKISGKKKKTKNIWIEFS